MSNSGKTDGVYSIEIDESDGEGKLSKRTTVPATSETVLPLVRSVTLSSLYVLSGTVYSLLIRYIKMLQNEGMMHFDDASIVFMVELLKWLFCVVYIYFKLGKFLPVSVFQDEAWRYGVYYAVPSFIYFVYNNLTYYNLRNFDPATYQVVMQTRVLFTGLMSFWVLKRVLTTRKWLGLLILMLGVASKYMNTSSFMVDGRIVFVLFQASLSSFASVYNEFLLKQNVSMDVNEQNFFMYSFSLVFNLSWGVMSNPTFYTSGKVFSSSTEPIILLIALFGCFMGISTALILKHINSIVKAFASATEVILTAILAAIFLNESLTLLDIVAFGIVMLASYIYY